MRKVLAAAAVIAFFAATADAVLAQNEPTDAQMRAAFCLGALDQAIEDTKPLYAEPPPPMYLTPDGRGYTPPAVARQEREEQQYLAQTLNEFARRRDRLKNYLLPFLIGNADLLPLVTAKNAGARVYNGCVRPGSSSRETCRRLLLCSKLDWMPY